MDFLFQVDEIDTRKGDIGNYDKQGKKLTKMKEALFIDGSLRSIASRNQIPFSTKQNMRK